jgi:hypothetical protein
MNATTKGTKIQQVAKIRMTMAVRFKVCNTTLVYTSAGKERCEHPEGWPALSEARGVLIGSPARTRTSNLAVTSAPAFRSGLDYIITPKGVGRFDPFRIRGGGLRPFGLVSARSLRPEPQGFAQDSLTSFEG